MQGAMADSARWRELATQFRELPAACQMLRADRHYIVNTGGVGRWKLIGTISDIVRFEALARRAGAELPSPVTHDLLTAWLEAVMAQGDSGFQFNPIATEMNADGTDGVQHMTGTMFKLPEASANFCAMQESWALQREYEKNFPNDPKNWSEFRHRVEAFESMKELGNEPPYRISEAVVRNIIADMDGIKPEDVTWKRIGFEIAAMGGPTRRHIEVVPSTSPGSPVADEKHVYVGIDRTQKQEKPEPIQDAFTPPIIDKLVDPKTLRDSYVANFPNERIKIRDLCWAAGQHYREWKRWLAGELKPGSTPDLAFRRVLMSKKRPQELNKKPRPSNWE